MEDILDPLDKGFFLLADTGMLSIKHIDLSEEGENLRKIFESQFRIGKCGRTMRNTSGSLNYGNGIDMIS